MPFRISVILFSVYQSFAFEYPINPIYTVKTFKSPNVNVNDWGSYETCNLTVPECNPDDKYRSFDGSCNNLQHPAWGITKSTYARIFEPRYSDGIEALPVAVDGNELPNSRKIVTTAFGDKDVPDTISLVISQWAQFVSHDTSAPVSKPGYVDCCAANDPLVCLKIVIPEDDPFYSQYNVTCLSSNRTQTNRIGDCSNEKGPKEQLNGVSHSLDASQIYGSDFETADSLREHIGGRLIVRTTSDGRCFLSSKGHNCFNSDICYVAGESRVNQNPPLTVLQTLWVREHNRIADALSALQPDWNDEILFQETRKILIAEYVHITYNGFLPLILPEESLSTFGLSEFQYDEDVPNLVVVSFTNPVYRIFHSSSQGVLALYNYHLKATNHLNLSDYYNSPAVLEEENNFDELILGLITQPMQSIDTYYSTEFSEKLFKFGQSHGSDLIALDIERSRDFGVASYPTFLYGCRGIAVNDFDDLADLWPADKIELARRIYTSVDDIDLFVAINFENKIEGHRLSPVAECITAEQFYRWKNGDRFWYEIKNQLHSFSSEQLDEIKKASLSRVVCDTSDHIAKITRNSWLPPSDDNPIVPCSDIPSIDLSKWA